jgi:hypothetical protein
MDKESKMAINRVTGVKRELTKKIWSNQFRMRTGNWQLIEQPTGEIQSPVSANMPSQEMTFEEPPPYIPEPIQPTEQPTEKSKTKSGKK